MLLKHIAQAAPGLIRIIGNENAEVRAVCSDSRKVVPGALFFCIPGMRHDAHDYAPQVKEAGVAELYKLVKEAGGMMIHAHPYREEVYIPEIRLFPEAITGDSRGTR